MHAKPATLIMLLPNAFRAPIELFLIGNERVQNKKRDLFLSLFFSLVNVKRINPYFTKGKKIIIIKKLSEQQ